MVISKEFNLSYASNNRMFELYDFSTVIHFIMCSLSIYDKK